MNPCKRTDEKLPNFSLSFSLLKGNMCCRRGIVIMAVLGAGTWGFPSLFLFLKGNRSRDRATGCLRGWTKIGV